MHNLPALASQVNGKQLDVIKEADSPTFHHPIPQVANVCLKSGLRTLKAFHMNWDLGVDDRMMFSGHIVTMIWR